METMTPRERMIVAMTNGQPDRVPVAPDMSNMIPLEAPPMGDCDLAELKRLYGDRLALMGNLHTTEVMLLGTPDTVERAARQAIEAAGAGDGFILSTGDQCGRDTPDENIFRLVEAARRYGQY